jgi:hypothetical protein
MKLRSDFLLAVVLASAVAAPAFGQAAAPAIAQWLGFSAWGNAAPDARVAANRSLFREPSVSRTSKFGSATPAVIAPVSWLDLCYNGDGAQNSGDADTA